MQRELVERCDAMGGDTCTLLVGAIRLADQEAQSKLVTPLRKFCEGGHAASCSTAATLLGGSLAPADRIALLTRACDLDASHCNLAAVCFEGKCTGGFPADATAARHANERACNDFKTKVHDPSAVATFAPCTKVTP